MPDNSSCYCGSGLPYAQCCDLYLSGQKAAPTAEALMRSRFTAFALKQEAYLLASWDKETRPKNIDFSHDNSEWLRLEVVMLKKGMERDKKGIVEFKAYYQLDGEEHVMSEISRFKKQDGKWFYLDGKVKSIAKTDSGTLNQGKNAPCPCGSGKKYKRCCGNA